MKFLPSYNVFDDMFTDAFRDPFFQRKNNAMKTDIKENDQAYELSMELPGYDKSEINLSLDNGYLTINAVKNETKEEKDEDGKVVRQERYTGSASRSFYVSDYVKEEDIKAKFENGELRISVPKKDTPEIEEKKTIAIE